MSKKDIKYNIDAITVKGNITEVIGWNVLSDNNTISVVDKSGKQMPFELEIIDRNDLVMAGYAPVDKKFCGFKLNIDGNDYSNYYLVINESKIGLARKKRDISLHCRVFWFKAMIKLVNVTNIKKTIKYIKRNGFRGLKKKIFEKSIDPMHYNDWFNRHRITEEQLKEQRNTQFEYAPKISILVPTYNTPIPMLREMIDSVRAQSYFNWELCIADGSVDNIEIQEELKRYHQLDNRIIYKILDENKGISGNTNGALDLATGEYIGLLDHDDTVEPDLLFEIISALQDDEYDIIYTDEDKVSNDLSAYMDPNFKPDFSIDLFRSHNYITHFFAVKKTIMDEVGGFRSEFDGSQDYDVMFRCIEKSNKIHHIAKILYHWRLSAGSTAENPESKMYCYDAGKHAIEAHLERVGIKGKVEHAGLWGMYHTSYDVIGSPLVSVIIANKDHAKDLDKCIKSILKKSTYKNLEFIIVENNSTEKESFDYYERIQKEYNNVHVIKWEREFNYSAINNYGVQHSNGEYILLLNNDTEMISPTAIEEMLGICMRDDVGIVGAKLLYGDNTVQHAGVVIGFGGYAGHVFNGIDRNDYGYMVRARINCNYSAVTAACLLTKREIFDKVDGLTEEFVVAGNDIDFCLKVRELGYLVVYNAFAEWYHYESKSRGYEDTPEKKARFEGEVAKFQKRWGKILAEGDPYYNKNFPVTIAPFTLD